ncbi:SH3-domain-containing protein [Parathielavia hyrcaniae]|uniref:SH3-domain-containing protein n=1 Tax=Parathielavia hyrcaniae TaxID=113614 RepID=A0AAN6T311_9PEZI|nr:SH3-domain-containing protein [Parathielavia hyrcaniae]
MDRQQIIETNRSLRLVKNELESLLEKGVITDTAFDSIHALLPAESPLSGGPAATRSANPTPAPAAQSAAALPTPSPSTSNPSPAPAASPPTYAQSTASPPSLPVRNNPAGPPAADSRPILSRARALYRYAGTDARDVSFERDDTVAVLEYMNADWWMGRNLRTGREGIFPRSYVVVVDGAAEQKNRMMSPPPMAYPQPQQPQAGPGYYPVAPVPVGGYAPPPQQQQYAPQQQEGGGEGGGSKVEEHGKKFGKKLGNAAIFGAGATIGSNIVNSIF